MEEVWKDIEGYEGLYRVSNLGRVISLNYHKEHRIKELSYGSCWGNYKTVVLCKNSEMKTYKVHRLVAEAFIPNPDNKPCIDHIDANPQNNIYTNLRWATYKENSNNPLTIKKYKDSLQGKIGKNSRAHKPVTQYSLDGNFIKNWDCISDVKRVLNINVSNICECCKGIRKTAGGYKWEFKKAV